MGALNSLAIPFHKLICISSIAKSILRDEDPSNWKCVTICSMGFPNNTLGCSFNLIFGFEIITLKKLLAALLPITRFIGSSLSQVSDLSDSRILKKIGALSRQPIFDHSLKTIRLPQ
jgi:hypothetical protein